MEVSGKGVILKACSDSAIVSVLVNGVRKSFSFGRGLFYVFQVQCDGRMDNILEDGVDVEVRYKLFNGNDPCITAVWIGDEPDCIRGVSTQRAIYNQKCNVSSFLREDSVIARFDDDSNVLISKGVLFRDGLRPDKSEPFLAVGDKVTVDAIPFNGTPGSQISYKATCCWIGVKEPRLIDRFGLLTDDGECERNREILEKQYIYGTVVVIPNDVVAFIDLEDKRFGSKVLLSRGSFDKTCDRIQDSIAIGDKLCLRLRLVRFFRGFSLWFAVKARKDGLQVVSDEKAVDATPIIEDLKNKTMPKPEKYPAAEYANLGKLESSPKHYTKFSRKSEVLYGHPPLSGTISSLSNDTACISFNEDLMIFVDRCDVYVNGSSCTPTQFQKLVSSGKNCVKFEAVLTSRTNEPNITHDATRVWVGEKPSLSKCINPLHPPKFSFLKRANQTFFGVVRKFCLPEVAIVVVEDEDDTVYLHVSAFGRKPKDLSEYASKELCIAHYVKLGQTIQFKVRCFGNSALPYACDVKMCSENTGDVRKWPILSKSVSSTSIKVSEKFNANLSTGQSPSAKTIEKTEIKREPFTRKECHLIERSMLFNCAGKLTTKEGNLVVTHVTGSFQVGDPIVYGLNNNKPLGTSVMSLLNDWPVRFDAEVTKLANSENSFIVKRMYTRESACPRPEISLISDLSFPVSLPPDEWHYGRIVSTPLWNCAIALVRNAKVLVGMDCLIVSEERLSKYCTINDFLSCGDGVLLQIQEEKFKGKNIADIDGKYFKAVKCWSLLGTCVNPSVLGPMGSTAGELNYVCAEGDATKKGDRYFAKSTHSQESLVQQVGVTLSTEILQHFAGEVVSLPQPVGTILANLSGIEVSFELSHVVIPQKINPACDNKSTYHNYLKTKIRVGTKVCFSAMRPGGKSGKCRAFEVVITEP